MVNTWLSWFSQYFRKFLQDTYFSNKRKQKELRISACHALNFLIKKVPDLPKKRKEFNEIIQDLLDKAEEKEKEEKAKNPEPIVENGAQAIKEQANT